MRIKQDENLAILANMAHKDPDDVVYILTQALLNVELIENNVECYGLMLKECIDGDTPVIKVVRILNEMGITTVNDYVYEAFCKCIVIGDGNCPNCGGELCLDDFGGREISTGDRDTEPRFVAEWEQWHCPICGYNVVKDLT